MAKINFGGGVTDMRGKLAGNAFSRNKSGAYVRAKVTPVNPNSDRQAAVRAAFGGVSAAWRTLTDVQRATFVDQAPNYPKTDIFGNQVARSGQQLYMHLNQQLVALGLPTIDVCPPPIDVTAPTVESVAVDVTAGVIELGGLTTPGTGERLVIEATMPMSAGVSNAGTKYRLIEPDATVAGGQADVSAAYAAVFGPVTNIPEGTRVFFRIYNVREANGQTSAYNSINGIATA